MAKVKSGYWVFLFLDIFFLEEVRCNKLVGDYSQASLTSSDGELTFGVSLTIQRANDYISFRS